MKTIAIIINDLKGNGAERVMITLANEFISQGHQCHIVCFNDVYELPSKNALNIHIFPMKYWRWIPRKWRAICLARILDKFIIRCTGSVPDLILSNLLPSDRIMSASKLPNVYFIIHSMVSRELGDITRRSHIQDGVNALLQIYQKKPAICVSKGVLDDFRYLFPNHSDSRNIYNPVDIAYIRISASYPNPLSSTSSYLIHVGKFNQAKRHDRLLKAYAQSDTQIPLILVGQGPLLEKTKTLANELGINKKVIFAGFHANPYPIIAGATALILSSDYEGLPTVILEALVLDVPVISTDCLSGPREILPKNNLVAVDDETALAKKIHVVSATPEPFKMPMPEKFTSQVVTQQYLGLINE